MLNNLICHGIRSEKVSKGMLKREKFQSPTICGQRPLYLYVSSVHK